MPIIHPQKALTRSEGTLRQAKKGLKNFLPEVEEVQTIGELRDLINQASKKAEQLAHRDRVTLCYHRLATNAVMKRGA